MKKYLLLAMPLLLLGLNLSQPETHEHYDGFVPKELERQLFEEEAGSTIDEKIFNEVLDKVSKYYAPIIEKRGGKLQINRLWTNNTINASASRSGTTYVLNMYGGLARHVETTADGFALVACHELGHHLGETPRYPNSWAASEGQSDYFGALKCFKKVFEREDNTRIISTATVDSYAKEKCNEFYTDVNLNSLCQRGAMAGLSLGRLLDVLGGSNPPKVKFNTPDGAVVTSTNNAHPKAQCRLDTYFAGALCPIDHNLDLDPKDENINTCHYKMDKKFWIGARPKCWYKPSAI